MIRLRRLMCGVVVALLVLSAALPVRATDEPAQELLRRWTLALRAAPRMSIKFRIHHFDTVFEREQRSEGTYYRIAEDRWALHLQPPTNMPVSALEPENRRGRNVRSLAPFAAICSPDVLWLGAGDPLSFERYEWPAVSAEDAVNIQPQFGWSSLAQSFHRRMIESFTPPLMLPLFFVGSPESLRLDVKLVNRPPHDVWLTFTPPRHQFEAGLVRQVDAVFRSNDDLPYAVRIVDPARFTERRIFVDEVRRDEEAEIPEDAFRPPASLLRSPPPNAH
jgi:hypothetical protein